MPIQQFKILPAAAVLIAAFNADIRCAAADIPVHGPFDFGIAGLGVCFQQCGGVHDLPGLTVAALGHVVLQPCLLHGVVAVFR